jgi:hypothetical protein
LQHTVGEQKQETQDRVHTNQNIPNQVKPPIHAYTMGKKQFFTDLNSFKFEFELSHSSLNFKFIFVMTSGLDSNGVQ